MIVDSVLVRLNIGLGLEIKGGSLLQYSLQWGMLTICGMHAVHAGKISPNVRVCHATLKKKFPAANVELDATLWKFSRGIALLFVLPCLCAPTTPTCVNQVISKAFTLEVIFQ